MTWLRLDDQFHRHRKVAPLSDAAFRLHVTALLECSNQLTDGRIDCVLVPTLPRAPSTKAKLNKITTELEQAGLWIRDGDSWILHGYLDWNPSAEEVLRKREARAKAGQKGGKRSGESRAKAKQSPANSEANASAAADQTTTKNEPKTNPVPVPVPVPDPKAAEADPRPPAGSDPTPSRVRRQQQRREESLDEPEVAEPPSRSRNRERALQVPIAAPQPDAQPVLEPDPTQTPSRPKNRSQALQVPIRERAQVLVDEEHLESWLEPHRWPEVVELGERFATALGWTRPRMTRASDARRLVHLLAAFDAAELDRAVESAPSDDWLTTGRKGLGSLSVEVVSRLLAPKRVAKARSTRYPHRQPDYEGERTFSAADLFAGGDGYVIAGAGGGR